MYFLLMVVLHKRKNQLSVFTNAVSDYGITSGKKIFLYLGLSTYLSNLFLSFAFLTLSNDFTEKYFAFYLLLLRGISVLGVIIFPTELDNRPTTKSSKMHLFFVIIQFTALAVFIFNIIIPLHEYTGNQFEVLVFLKYIIEIGLYGLCVALILKPIKRYFGIFERIFLYASALFILFLDILMIMN
ncbi:DUF998 domain-containing protein [Streptococcus urinalis]|uniref:DUF998 domain-containing protein n=1 Tax=Streptococcus urinalis TaxID=149016 RepID=UPI0022ABEF64|nr:DUF998 domain-containing protein [Streptococcus urinalis]